MDKILTIAVFFLAVTVLAAQEPGGSRFFETDTSLYVKAEEMPRYPGCEDLSSLQEKEDCSMRQMLMFLYGEMSYPAEARKRGVEGRAVVTFIVEKDGSLTDFKLLEDPGAGCGAEALRVIQMMPNFVPGKQHGKAVRVLYKLPVKFSVH